MCHAELGNVETIVDAEVVQVRPGGASEAFFAVATLLLVGIAVLIGVGLAIEEMGMAIVYAIVAAPAVIATLVRVQYRKRQVGQVSWAEWFVTLVVSASIVIAVLVLLVVASIAALILYCFAAGPPSFH
jgi:hypothetical protein